MIIKPHPRIIPLTLTIIMMMVMMALCANAIRIHYSKLYNYEAASKILTTLNDFTQTPIDEITSVPSKAALELTETILKRIMDTSEETAYKISLMRFSILIDIINLSKCYAHEDQTTCNASTISDMEKSLAQSVAAIEKLQGIGQADDGLPTLDNLKMTLAFVNNDKPISNTLIESELDESNFLMSNLIAKVSNTAPTITNNSYIISTATASLILMLLSMGLSIRLNGFIYKIESGTALSSRDSEMLSRHQKLTHDHENMKKEADFLKTLQSLIGYEIRSFVNVIDSGIRLLTSEMDESKQGLALEVIKASSSLVGLSNNFSGLFNISSRNTEESFNVFELFNEVSQVMASTFKMKNIPVETFIPSNIPATYRGKKNNLYWCLIIYFSKVSALIDEVPNSLFFYIDSSDGNRVQDVSISFNLAIIDHPNTGIVEILNGNFTKEKKECDSQFIDFSALSGNAVEVNTNNGTINPAGISCHRFSISTSATGIADRSEKLKDKQAILCGSSALQSSTIKLLIEQSGGQVFVAETPNTLFKNMAIIKQTQILIVTDTVKGIDLLTFCKTLKARINKIAPSLKVILYASDYEIGRSVGDYADFIFYKPMNYHSFIAKLLEVASDIEEDKANKSVRILAVDDDRMQLFMVEEILTNLGYIADTVGGGKDAIDQFKNSEHHIVLMDCIMPGVDGFEATRAIRSHEESLPADKRARCSIIGTTALTGSEETMKCMDAGMDYIIRKPINEEELSHLIKKCLALHKVK